MLDKSDTETVQEWLRDALARGEAVGKHQAGLAAFCRVSPQAVHGWVKTGRITKSNLEVAALYFGHGPSFRHGGVAAREPGLEAWPFPRIARSRWNRLSDDDRAHIEEIVSREVAHLEKRSHQRRAAKAAA